MHFPNYTKVILAAAHGVDASARGSSWWIGSSGEARVLVLDAGPCAPTELRRLAPTVSGWTRLGSGSA